MLWFSSCCGCLVPFIRSVMVADVSRHAGQMKDIITTGLGMILFGDVQFSSKNLFGISVGLLGGMMYSFFGYMERQRQKRQQNKVWQKVPAETQRHVNVLVGIIGLSQILCSLVVIVTAYMSISPLSIIHVFSPASLNSSLCCCTVHWSDLYISDKGCTDWVPTNLHCL